MASHAGLGWWTLRPTAHVDEEIDDEFEFHIDSRIQELMAAGWEPDAARAEAERQFGERSRWRTACRREQLGAGRWLLPAGAMALLLVSLTTGWFVWRLQLANAMLVEQRELALRMLAAAQLPDEGAAGDDLLLAAAADKQDLTGEVRDAAGKPIRNARIVVIHKSWPNNRYRQDSFHTQTGDDGAFRLPKLFVPGTQVAFLVTVLAEGHAMQSEYVLKKKGEEVQPFQFKLKPAVAKTLIVKDSAGAPVANTTVFPTTRRTGNPAVEYLIYYQSADDTGFKTDGDGKVRMSIFEAGDDVDLGVMTKPDSAEVTVHIDANAEQTVTLPAAK